MAGPGSRRLDGGGHGTGRADLDCAYSLPVLNRGQDNLTAAAERRLLAPAAARLHLRDAEQARLVAGPGPPLGALALPRAEHGVRGVAGGRPEVEPVFPGQPLDLRMRDAALGRLAARDVVDGLPVPVIFLVAGQGRPALPGRVAEHVPVRSDNPGNLLLRQLGLVRHGALPAGDPVRGPAQAQVLAGDPLDLALPGQLQVQLAGGRAA